MAFEDWKGDYLLQMAGEAGRARLLRSSQGSAFLKYLSAMTPERMRSLNRPDAVDSFALFLKNNDLVIPEAHEIGALDASSPEEVERFIHRWSYEHLPIPEALRLFAYRGFPDRFDRRVLIRNIVFRTWLWIQKGLLPRIDNVVRDAWYRYVKPVLSEYRILEADDYERYFEELRYLTRVKELGILYGDFGFVDYERGVYWDVGTKRPDILLYAEKEELKVHFDELNSELGASYLVNHGQPSRFQLEVLALEIAQLTANKPVQLVAAVDFNPGGFAIEGAGIEGLSYHGLAVQTHRLLELRALSQDQIDEFRDPLAEAIRKADGSVEVTFGSASNLKQCENWFTSAVQDPRFREEKPVPGGVKVSYYGFDMNVLGAEWITYRLNRIVKKILEEGAAKPSRRVPRGMVWQAWLADYRHQHGLSGHGGTRQLRRAADQARDLVMASAALAEAGEPASQTD